MSKLKLVVIGAGGHSSLSHGPSLCEWKKRYGDAIELSAVCDLDIDKAKSYAGRFGFERYYGGIDEMLAKETPDGIVAVTPVNGTVKIISDLLPLGIPLVIEKPAGRNSEEAGKLLELVRASGTPHMVSFNRRFTPAILKAKDWLKANAANRPPRFLLARMLRNCRTEPTFVKETGIHLVDSVLQFMSRPLKVSSSRCDFVWNGKVTFDDGAMAQLVMAPQTGVTEESYEIMGQDYCIQIDTMRCGIRIFDRGEEVLSWIAESGPEEYEYRGGGFFETEYFINNVCKKQLGTPNVYDAYLAMLVAEAIHAETETSFDKVLPALKG